MSESLRLRRKRSSMAVPPDRIRICPTTAETDAFRSEWHRVWHSVRRRRRRRHSRTRVAVTTRWPSAAAARCRPSPARRTHAEMMDALPWRHTVAVVAAAFRRRRPTTTIDGRATEAPPRTRHSAAAGRERVADIVGGFFLWCEKTQC